MSMWMSDSQSMRNAPYFPLRCEAMRRDSFASPAQGSLGSSMVSQILFLIGLTIIIGPQKTLFFFARKQKAKGTAAFFAGLILILIRWTFIGFLIEAYGIAILFGDFFGTIAGFARGIPVIGPYIGMLVDRIGLGRRNVDLPV
ncbi:hypothetical protein E4U55_000099 [Claviceps digitariae]|nr:hypothetical protein E4U55_000099 [Claviceps digitariae]